MNNENIKVIYIGGYGRSGSTLLDVVLSGHPEVFGGGELNQLFEVWMSGGFCSCGELISNCVFWRRVLDDLFDRLKGMDVSKAAQITRQNENYWRTTQDSLEYTKLWGNLFAIIAHRSKCFVIVDSSKTTRLSYHRPGNLMEIYSCRFHMFHLVRDIHSVLQSVASGSNRKLEAGLGQPVLLGGRLRGLIGWLWANHCVEKIEQNGAGCNSVELLRFEDFLSDPASLISRVFHAVDLRPDKVISIIANNQLFDPGHGVAGNRMRRSGAIQFMPKQNLVKSFPLVTKLLGFLAQPMSQRYY